MCGQGSGGVDEKARKDSGMGVGRSRSGCGRGHFFHHRLAAVHRAARSRTLTARKFDNTPARLARGAYLVNHVIDCMACHAEHDWTNREAPILPGTLGSGQDMNLLKGLPGKVYAPNITPDPETGTGNWTDDQLARGIREGVGYDGRALF